MQYSLSVNPTSHSNVPALTALSLVRGATSPALSSESLAEPVNSSMDLIRARRAAESELAEISSRISHHKKALSLRNALESSSGGISLARCLLCVQSSSRFCTLDWLTPSEGAAALHHFVHRMKSGEGVQWTELGSLFRAPSHRTDGERVVAKWLRDAFIAQIDGRSRAPIRLTSKGYDLSRDDLDVTELPLDNSVVELLSDRADVLQKAVKGCSEQRRGAIPHHQQSLVLGMIFSPLRWRGRRPVSVAPAPLSQARYFLMIVPVPAYRPVQYRRQQR